MSFIDRILNIDEPFRYLEEDHRKIESLFDRIDETADSAVLARENLFAQLDMLLTIHAATEEEAVYPVLKALDATHDLAVEAVEEHHVVKMLLIELDALPPDSEEWMAKMTVLRENVEHHVKEEEGKLFKKARRELEDGQKEMMLNEMQKVRQREMAQMA